MSVLSALVRLTKETPKRLMKLTKKATKEENRLKIKQLEHSKQATPRWLKEFPWLQYKEEQSLNFVMFLLWIVENMILSFLESKILLWKVNFHIYFPQWQVMSKVSVEPCSLRIFVRKISPCILFLLTFSLNI